jgi:hypothetical protein
MIRATTEKHVDLDQALEAALEAEIRESVQCDRASLRRSHKTDSELVAINMVTLFQRVAGTSVQEIDSLIAELQTLRGLLQDRGARMQRNLAEYAHLSQSAIQSTKIIADSLIQSNGGGDCHHTPPRH